MASTGRVLTKIEEDWTTDNISTAAADGIRWLNSSDTGNTAFVRTAAAGLLTATAATDATDDDMCELAHDTLVWSPINGVLGMQTRVRCTSIGDVAMTIGFNDDALEDSNTLPVELATATFTSNAATFVGVVYDVDATNDEFHVFWVDDDADTSEAIADLRTKVAPGTSQWMTVSVALYDRGSGNGVRAEIDVFNESTGAHYNKAFNTNVDRDALLTPHIAFENRAGVAHTFDIGYIDVWMARP